MLQNLANKPSYAKEPYMIKLQPFLHENKERINKFLLDLCEVSDFYESLEMDNYVALSKKDLELSITLNEVYTAHSMLERHVQELVRVLVPCVPATMLTGGRQETTVHISR